mmetsp:Transcript_55635/g.107333  ORF Transcript_55635/g.107333 Transcript_55635/m.107333 type:complete len:870 (-) Transcript_55635:168-2777(-)
MRTGGKLRQSKVRSQNAATSVPRVAQAGANSAHLQVESEEEEYQQQPERSSVAAAGAMRTGGKLSQSKVRSQNSATSVPRHIQAVANSAHLQEESEEEQQQQPECFSAVAAGAMRTGGKLLKSKVRSQNGAPSARSVAQARANSADPQVESAEEEQQQLECSSAVGAMPVVGKLHQSTVRSQNGARSALRVGQADVACPQVQSEDEDDSEGDESNDLAPEAGIRQAPKSQLHTSTAMPRRAAATIRSHQAGTALEEEEEEEQEMGAMPNSTLTSSGQLHNSKVRSQSAVAGIRSHQAGTALEEEEEEGEEEEEEMAELQPTPTGTIRATPTSTLTSSKVMSQAAGAAHRNGHQAGIAQAQPHTESEEENEEDEEEGEHQHHMPAAMQGNPLTASARHGRLANAKQHRPGAVTTGVPNITEATVVDDSEEEQDEIDNAPPAVPPSHVAGSMVAQQGNLSSARQQLTGAKTAKRHSGPASAALEHEDPGGEEESPAAEAHHGPAQAQLAHGFTQDLLAPLEQQGAGKGNRDPTKQDRPAGKKGRGKGRGKGSGRGRGENAATSLLSVEEEVSQKRGPAACKEDVAAVSNGDGVAAASATVPASEMRGGVPAQEQLHMAAQKQMSFSKRQAKRKSYAKPTTPEEERRARGRARKNAANANDVRQGPGGTQALHFAATGIQLGAEQRSLMARLGASVVEDWGPEVTHLIADTFRRTTKMMCAISLGLEVVTADYIQACSRAGQRVDEGPYRLRDTVCEAGFARKRGLKKGYSLEVAIKRAQQNGPLLKGMSVYCFPSVTDQRELPLLVGAAGGSWLSELPESPDDPKVLLLAERSISGDSEKRRRKAHSVYDVELLREAACTQELRHSAYRLS